MLIRRPVAVTASDSAGTDEAKVTQAIDASGGFRPALADGEAFLEHGVELHPVADRRPAAHAKGRARP
jgi:hypothetical protein